jgi:hypothetical protein
MTSPPSYNKILKIGLCPSHIISYVLSYSRGCDSTNKPLAFNFASLIVFMRSLPLFPLYSLAGAINKRPFASHAKRWLLAVSGTMDSHLFTRCPVSVAACSEAKLSPNNRVARAWRLRFAVETRRKQNKTKKGDIG